MKIAAIVVYCFIALAYWFNCLAVSTVTYHNRDKDGCENFLATRNKNPFMYYIAVSILTIIFTLISIFWPLIAIADMLKVIVSKNENTDETE